MVAQQYYGDKALWCYRAFKWVNKKLFLEELPFPLIVLGLTAHGHCLGQTHLRVDGPPVICIHPSVWGGTENKNPWGVPADLLGDRYALDVLIHECMHVSVCYRLKGPTGGTSSHDNPEWINEVNRIAPLIGLNGVVAARNKVVREGKKTRRASQGNIPFNAVATFPSQAVRGLDYYRDRSPLPF
jgi:hypothetical protein